MRRIVTVVLALVAVVHALPAAGVLGAERLASLYGVSIEDPNVEILMRHRAVLFGLLAGFLAVCACRPQWHGHGLVAAFVSVASFLALAWSVGGYNASLSTVVHVDLAMLVLLVIAGIARSVRSDAA